MKLQISAAALLLTLALAGTAKAFVSTPSSRVSSMPQTSTTLYYRDDVPPIGSAPKWETPNDFDQFLTQCTIQSFTFLLKSLRDDPTVRWLDDFTEPVYEKHGSSSTGSNSNTGSAAPAPEKKAPPPKVSLAEAANAALMETAKVLETAKALGKGKVILPKKLEETVGSVKKQKNVMNTATLATIENKTKKPAPDAHMTLLHENIALQTAFSSFSKAKLLAMPNKIVEEEIDIPSPPEPPLVSNTGISQLYSSTGVNKGNNPVIIKRKYSPLGQGGDKPHVKENFSPFGKKPKAVSPAPLGSTGSIQGKVPLPSPPPKMAKKVEEAKKKGFSPFGNKPRPVPRNKYTGGFLPVPDTSPLYGGGENTKDESDDEVEAKGTPGSMAGSVLKYHGLGILNNTKFPTWDAYFEKMLDQPKHVFLVQSGVPDVPDLELDIDPASLVRRMVSVRAQIAEEFEHDLQVIADMGGLTLKSYHKMIAEIREQRAEEELQQQKDDLEGLMDQSMEDSICNHNGAKSTEDVDATQPVKPQMQRANLLFLGRAVGEGDKADIAPSPLRKGNFDLLCLLSTQEAIHRVLNDPSRQARKSPEHGSNQFLQDFYVTRLLSHFSGDQPFGRADDFVEELLDCPPRMITVGSNNDDKPEEDDQHEDSLTKDLTYLVDPVKVAEIIMNEREVVALQWKQHLAEQTKEDHMAVQRMVLAKIMEGTMAEECEIVDPVGNDVEDVDFGSCFE